MSRQAHETENPDGRVREPKSHEMGVQIPCRVYPEVPKEKFVSGVAKALDRSISAVGAAEREPDRRRTLGVRSRAYVDCDSAEVCGVASGGVHQRQECDSLGANLWGKEAEFHRATFLGKRILCVDGRSRRGTNTSVYPEPGARRSPTGSAEPVALTGTERCHPKTGPR